MSALIDKRKRSREDDALCESTPLSKRINNLHLSNFEEVHFNHHQSQQSHYGMHQQQQHQPQHNNHPQQLINESKNNQDLLNSTAYSSHANCLEILEKIDPLKSLNSNMNMIDDKSLYSPELNETENPFYYVKNKLLHELHLERLKRTPV